MTAPARRQPRPSRRSFRALRRFGAAREGASAVEFAMVAGPFILMVFALLETSYVFFVSTTLEHATMEASRQIRTGELVLSGSTPEDFETAVCEGIEILMPCEDHLYLDVRVYDDFDSVAGFSPVAGGEFDDDELGVDFGEAGDIVVVRSYYIWRVFTPNLGTGLANLNGGRRLIVSSVAFRNEPYGDGS